MLNTQDKLSPAIYAFLESHRADDIVYALANPEYFGLTSNESLELHAFVFQAINTYKLS